MRVVALAGAVGLLAMCAPASWAAPGDRGGAVVDAPTVPLAQLGSDPELVFYGLQGTQQLTVPVPRGLTAAALNATVELPVDRRAGMITVTQDERTIARVNLPADDRAPIVIPLVGAEVINDWATVVVRTYLSHVDDDWCVDPTNSVRLVNLAVSYTGAERPPTAVTDFLPPLLRKLTIFLPPSPSKSESEAAIQLAAATTAQYGKQDPEISVVRLNDGQAAPTAPSAPLERQIVVKEGPGEGVSLRGAPGVPWVLISGPGEELRNQTQLLFSGLSRLAFAAKAVAGPLSSTVQLPGDETTLRDLGQPYINAVGLSPQATIELNQTKFGRSIHGVRVHLQGSYTPVPSTVGGQIFALIDGETIDHWPTDSKGKIDRWVDIPDRLLKRFTKLDVLMRVSANTGPCGNFHTPGAGDELLTLTIDGDSTVQSSPAAPPVPGGLQSVPQALMPEVQVAIGADAFGDTMRAVGIMVSLQRMSELPLDTVLKDVQEVVDSPNPGIVVAGDGWNTSDVVLPVSAGPDGPISVNNFQSGDQPGTLTLDPNVRFASLQTVFDRDRTLLVATSNGAPKELDRLVGWLNGDRERWSRLDGVALVSAPGHDPVTVNAGTGPSAPPSQAKTDLTKLWVDPKWRWWVGGGAAAVAVVCLLTFISRSRRKSTE